MIGIPAKFSGAHTHRQSGADGVNFYNFPKRPKKGYELIMDIKKLVHAPKGYLLLTFDYAQIEARYLAYLAGQDDLVEAFREGRDVYSEAATAVFGKKTRKPRPSDPLPIAKGLTIRRNFGKQEILGCIAKGTLIVTKTGWKPIEQITKQDKLWDGVSWVSHKGLIYRGKKQCLNVSGVWLTQDHEVLTRRGWLQAGILNTLHQKSGTSMESLPLQKLYTDHMEELSPSNVVAPVVEHLIRTETTLSLENLPVVISVLKKHLVYLIPYMTLSRLDIVRGLLIEFVQSLAVAATQKTRNILTTEDGESPCTLGGLEIEQCFLGIWFRCRAGIIQDLKLTGLTMTADTFPEICGLLLEANRCGTPAVETLLESGQRQIADGVENLLKENKGGSHTAVNTALVLLPTYDIMSAGPRKRFQAGKLVVSNCGYGMGSSTFYNRCMDDPSLRSIITTPLAEKIVKSYRKTYSKIPRFWKDVENKFKFIVKYPEEKMKLPCNILFEHEQFNNQIVLTLPSGSRLYYPDTRRCNSSGNLKWRHSRGASLWGGAICENIIQSTCRDILVDAILAVKHAGYTIVADLYDSFTVLVKKEQVKEAEEELTNMITVPPVWAAGVPLATESEISETL